MARKQNLTDKEIALKLTLTMFPKNNCFNEKGRENVLKAYTKNHDAVKKLPNSDKKRDKGHYVIIALLGFPLVMSTIALLCHLSVCIG